MSVKAILTNRELKNKVTGIDLYVSDYQEIPHRIKNTYLYHVIVVTNLFYYKSREHRESDIVQFMISKSFEEFEELYQKLYKRFPSVNFPSLPSKSLLSSNTAEKLKCMDSVLKLVAATQKLCSSPMLISFLKGDTNKKAAEPPQKIVVKDEEEKSETDEKKPTGNEPNEFEDVDLFEKQTTASSEDALYDDDTDGIFGKPNNTNTLSTKQSIFDDEPQSKDTFDDDLFEPSSAPAKSSFDKKYEIEDESDLLEVSDDFDELLHLSKNSEKQAAIKVEKPRPAARPQRKSQSEKVDDIFGKSDAAEVDDMFRQSRTHSIKKDRSDSSNISDVLSSKKRTTSLFDNDDDDDLFSSSKSKADIDSMGQDDIASYIMQEEKGANESSLGL